MANSSPIPTLMMTTREVTYSLPSRLGHARLMRLLGLPAADADPVTIITAAQVRLRRWRRNGADGAQRPRRARDRIRQISEARDVLLREALGAAGRSQMRGP